MASITCTRRIQFCAGHRVYGHENKCSNIHGHNYVLLATAVGSHLDNIGRVIDFSVIKEKLGGWIDTKWDHGFLVFEKDTPCREMLGRIKNSSGGDTKEYIMEENPTAENMAKHLIIEICPHLFRNTGIKISKIVLWETENCYAEVTL